MKKIIAGILALSMMFSFAACGDSSSTSDSSKASTSSSAADSSETNGQSESQAETSAVTEESSAAQTQSTEAPKTGEITTFEQSYTYKLNTIKNFAIELSAEIMGMKVPYKYEQNNTNFHISADMTMFGGESNTEIYYIDGKTYSIISSNKMYSIIESETNNQFASIANIGPLGDVQFISSTEENGMIVEKMKVTTDNPSGGKVTTDETYYYDKASGEPKRIIKSTSGMTSTTEITSFKVGEQNIVLPDLSGWTRVDANPNAGINAGTAGAAAANQ